MRPLATHLPILESSPDTRYNLGYPKLHRTKATSWCMIWTTKQNFMAFNIQPNIFHTIKDTCFAGWCGYPHQNCKGTCQTTQPRCTKWYRLETKGTAQATVNENSPMKKNTHSRIASKKYTIAIHALLVKPLFYTMKIHHTEPPKKLFLSKPKLIDNYRCCLGI